MDFFGDLKKMAEAIKASAKAVDAVVKTLDERSARRTGALSVSQSATLLEVLR